MGCVDNNAAVAAAVQLFYVRLAQLFNGRTVVLSGSGGWWTGEWTSRTLEDGSVQWYWTGDRFVGQGTVATMTATGPGSFHVSFGYSLANLGTWDDVYGNG